MTVKYLEIATTLQVSELEEAMGRAYSAASPDNAHAQGEYPIPPYSSPNSPPLPEEYTWYYLQRARLFPTNGGVIRISEAEAALEIATAAPTHQLSNGSTYTIVLGTALDYEQLSPEGQALWADYAPPPPEGDEPNPAPESAPVTKKKRAGRWPW